MRMGRRILRDGEGSGWKKKRTEELGSAFIIISRVHFQGPIVQFKGPIQGSSSSLIFSFSLLFYPLLPSFFFFATDRRSFRTELRPSRPTFFCLSFSILLKHWDRQWVEASIWKLQSGFGAHSVQRSRHK